jgi:hypothetical protein
VVAHIAPSVKTAMTEPGDLLANAIRKMSCSMLKS